MRGDTTYLMILKRWSFFQIYSIYETICLKEKLIVIGIGIIHWRCFPFEVQKAMRISWTTTDAGPFMERNPMGWIVVVAIAVVEDSMGYTGSNAAVITGGTIGVADKSYSHFDYPRWHPLLEPTW